MRFALLKTYILLLFLSGSHQLQAQGTNVEAERKVLLRMVGYKLLEEVGDSGSLVLPIVKDGSRYKISFSTEFKYKPESFSRIIDSVISVNGSEQGYLVEVQGCDRDEIVYSYKVGEFATLNSDTIIPCFDRNLPVGCYDIYFVFSDNVKPQVEASGKTNSVGLPQKSGNGSWWLWVLVTGLIAAAVIYFWRVSRASATSDSEEVISIGAYRFDKRNMHLTFNDETIELTSKEADLLFLLHSSANQTIERDVILRIVWGDDGDYVGRTLDVFISKLRKKLAGDPGVKIANIRGVGYRLVVND